MKIRIFGPCGSGKSYISRKLSQWYNIPYYELDHLVWNQEELETRNSLEHRDSMLMDIISSDSWIIEGTHISWTGKTFLEADIIFLLSPHPIFNDIRITKRFILSRLGLEKWNYKQSYSNLIKMIVEWNHGFNPSQKIIDTKNYASKRFLVRSGKEILNIINMQNQQDPLILESDIGEI